MFRQMLTQTDGSSPPRVGGLAGDFRNGYRESTCVLLASSISMGGWCSWAATAPRPSRALGLVVEADFTMAFGEPYVICGLRETPGEWSHSVTTCLLPVSRQGPRSNRITSFLRNWHEHSGSLIPAEREGIFILCLLLYSPDIRLTDFKNPKFCWSVTNCVTYIAFGTADATCYLISSNL